MLRSMSGQQFYEWIEYASLEPFGEERADLRMGILAASLVNNLAMIWTGESPETTPDDFMPKFEEKQTDPVEVANKIDAFFTMMAMASPTQ